MSEMFVFGAEVVTGTEAFGGLFLQEARQMMVRIANVTFDIWGLYYCGQRRTKQT